MLFLIIQIFLSGHVCVCPLKEKLMHIHSCKPTGTKSGHSSFNPMHFVNACVCVCICMCLCVCRVECNYNADAAYFLPEGGKREDKKKKEKIDTAARF